MTMKNLVIALIGFSTFFVNAHATAASGENGKDTGIYIIYAGKDVDHALFKLVVNRNKINTYLVTIKAENGTTLFSERLKGDSISRTYKFPPEQAGGLTGTSIEVKNLGSNEIAVYKIKSTYRLVDEILVTKL
jgi:hypothetical protein